MRFVVFNGKLVPWSEFARLRRESMTVSDLPCPSIIRDALDGVKNPIDGKRYDSKSEYYRTVRAAGCEIVGNEAEKMVAPSTARPDVTREEIGAAVAKVKQGYKPTLELEENADG